MADRIQLRRDTEANWIETDPILAQGEIAVTLDDLDTEPKFKVGDGLTLWSVLPYFGGTGLTQIQSDWNQANDLLIDYIKNKPTGTVDGDILIWDSATNKWEHTDYIAFTDTATSSILSILNGASPTLKSAALGVTDSNSYLSLQTDPSAPAGGQSIELVTSTTLQQLYVKHSSTDFVSILRNDTSGSLNITNGSGERVLLQSYKTPATTHKNIIVQDATIENFIVTNDGGITTMTLAGIGDRYIGADSTGRVKVMPATKGLAVHAADQIIPSTVAVAVGDFQIAGKANKKYMVDYRLYLLNSANEFSPNIQVRIGDGSGTETAYGSLLACHNDTASYNLYKVIDGTPNFNSLFDWAQGRAVYLHDGNYMHLDLQVIVEMGSTDKTIDLYITLPSTPTVPPEFTIRARSYMRWEEF